MLAPDQRIASVGYAMMAANVLDGAITAAKLANNAVTTLRIADDAITGAKIADGTITGANIVNESIGSLQLADSIDLGDTNSYGQLNVFRAGSTNTPAIMLEGLNNQIVSYGDDGLIQTRLWGPSWGQLQLWDGVGNDQVVALNANNDGGGSLQLMTSNNATRVLLRASTAGSDLSMYAADGGIGVFIDGDSSGAGLIDIRNTNGSARATLDGFGNAGGGQLSVNANDGSSSVQIYGDGPAAAGAGQISVNSPTAGETVRLSGHSFGGRLTAFDESGQMALSAGASVTAGGFVQLNANGDLRMNVDGDNAGAGYLALYGTNGAANIILNGNNSGDGRITTQELQITGGSDLSEKFDISSLREAVKPGMVVCIDPAKPGELVLSSKALRSHRRGRHQRRGRRETRHAHGPEGHRRRRPASRRAHGPRLLLVDASSGAIQPGDLSLPPTRPATA